MIPTILLLATLGQYPDLLIGPDPAPAGSRAMLIGPDDQAPPAPAAPPAVAQPANVAAPAVAPVRYYYYYAPAAPVIRYRYSPPVYGRGFPAYCPPGRT